jgi:hypothetical protein
VAADAYTETYALQAKVSRGTISYEQRLPRSRCRSSKVCASGADELALFLYLALRMLLRLARDLLNPASLVLLQPARLLLGFELSALLI